jgi:hypothetical protein
MSATEAPFSASSKAINLLPMPLVPPVITAVCLPAFSSLLRPYLNASDIRFHAVALKSPRRFNSSGDQPESPFPVQFL